MTVGVLGQAPHGIKMLSQVGLCTASHINN